MSVPESGQWEFHSHVRPARPHSWSPSFAALVRLMIDGPGAEDNVRGQVSARIMESQPVTFGFPEERIEQLGQHLIQELSGL